MDDTKSVDDSKDSNMRVKALQMEVKNQERDKELLNKTIERLQREKQQLLIDLSRQSGKTAKGIYYYIYMCYIQTKEGLQYLGFVSLFN